MYAAERCESQARVTRDFQFASARNYCALVTASSQQRVVAIQPKGMAVLFEGDLQIPATTVHALADIRCVSGLSHVRAGVFGPRSELIAVSRSQTGHPQDVGTVREIGSRFMVELVSRHEFNPLSVYRPRQATRWWVHLPD